jgi:hypothetical protein
MIHSQQPNIPGFRTFKLGKFSLTPKVQRYQKKIKVISVMCRDLELRTATIMVSAI